MANMVPFGGRRGAPTGGDDFYSMIDNFLGDPWFAGRRYGRDSFRMDVQENEGEYLVEAELPGVNKEEVDVQLIDGTLNIAVNREENIEEEKKNYLHRERRYVSMSRSVYLADAAQEGIRAKMDNGILNVSIPKDKKAVNSRRVEIE